MVSSMDRGGRFVCTNKEFLIAVMLDESNCKFAFLCAGVQDPYNFGNVPKYGGKGGNMRCQLLKCLESKCKFAFLWAGGQDPYYIGTLPKYGGKGGNMRCQLLKCLYACLCYFVGEGMVLCRPWQILS